MLFVSLNLILIVEVRLDRSVFPNLKFPGHVIVLIKISIEKD